MSRVSNYIKNYNNFVKGLNMENKLQLTTNVHKNKDGILNVDDVMFRNTMLNDESIEKIFASFEYTSLEDLSVLRYLMTLYVGCVMEERYSLLEYINIFFNYTSIKNKLINESRDIDISNAMILKSIRELGNLISDTCITDYSSVLCFDLDDGTQYTFTEDEIKDDFTRVVKNIVYQSAVALNILSGFFCNDAHLFNTCIDTLVSNIEFTLIEALYMYKREDSYFSYFDIMASIIRLEDYTYVVDSDILPLRDLILRQMKEVD